MVPCRDWEFHRRVQCDIINKSGYNSNDISSATHRLKTCTKIWTKSIFFISNSMFGNGDPLSRHVVCVLLPALFSARLGWGYFSLLTNWSSAHDSTMQSALLSAKMGSDSPFIHGKALLCRTSSYPYQKSLFPAPSSLTRKYPTDC